MKKCLIIKLHGNVRSESQKSIIQKNAQSLGIEGTLQSYEDGIIIHACGIVDKLDKFVDQVYGFIDNSKIREVEAEPFVCERDYRGAFRIIG